MEGREEERTEENNKKESIWEPREPIAKMDELYRILKVREGKPSLHALIQFFLYTIRPHWEKHLLIRPYGEH